MTLIRSLGLRGAGAGTAGPPTPAPTVTLEDFEDGSYAFTLVPGLVPWGRDTSGDSGRSGVFRSADITDTQFSSHEVLLTVPTGYTGLLSLEYRVSSESGYDYLRIHVDGVSAAAISGGGPWASLPSVVLSEGDHTLSLTYSKDSSVSAGLDAAFVDNIRLEVVPP